jgi:hypothetical protein
MKLILKTPREEFLSFNSLIFRPMIHAVLWSVVNFFP